MARRHREEHRVSAPVTQQEYRASSAKKTIGSSLAITAVVGAGVAILQPELLPGMAIGAAAVMAPKILPVFGTALKPLFRIAVRTAYDAALKAKEIAAGAGEQIQDIVAEAKAETQAPVHHPGSTQRG